jgi:hypothetical protein
MSAAGTHRQQEYGIDDPPIAHYDEVMAIRLSSGRRSRKPRRPSIGWTISGSRSLQRRLVHSSHTSRTRRHVSTGDRTPDARSCGRSVYSGTAT